MTTRQQGAAFSSASATPGARERLRSRGRRAHTRRSGSLRGTPGEGPAHPVRTASPATSSARSAPPRVIAFIDAPVTLALLPTSIRCHRTLESVSRSRRLVSGSRRPTAPVVATAYRSSWQREVRSMDEICRVPTSEEHDLRESVRYAGGLRRWNLPPPRSPLDIPTQGSSVSDIEDEVG
jgi:hypothetical protein